MNSGLVYFQDGELVAEVGEARVYEMNNELFLEIGKGHTLWALESELRDYIPQIGDLPKGECLEIGLGLGVASKYILSFPAVNTLTTVEVNSDVIAVQKSINPVADKWGAFSPDDHIILNCDGLSYIYKTESRYDFIFLDFYDRIDDETLPVIGDMVRGAKRLLNDGGSIVGWLDPYTPEEFIEPFYEIFEYHSK
jgi:spermidine synthase